MDYTKGIWRVWDVLPHYSIRVGRKNVATISSLNNTPNEEKEANANLIAAAPEMYEALKRVYNYTAVIDPISNEAMARALAKAEGKLNGEHKPTT